LAKEEGERKCGKVKWNLIAFRKNEGKTSAARRIDMVEKKKVPMEKRGRKV